MYDYLHLYGYMHVVYIGTVYVIHLFICNMYIYLYCYIYINIYIYIDDFFCIGAPPGLLKHPHSSVLLGGGSIPIW